MSSYIHLIQLPVDITEREAVEAAYEKDLQWIEERLRNGLSVLIECDKILSTFLFISLRDRLKQERNGKTIKCRLLGGRSDNERMGFMQSLLGNFREAVIDVIGQDSMVLALPHLDLLTTTTQSGLSLEAREAIAWMYENPEVVLLGFKDPSFEIPRVIEDVFTVKRSIIGLSRDVLPKILLQCEGRKLAEDVFNTSRLYKYISGLNVIKFRKIMEHFHTFLDYDNRNPDTAEQLYRQIREMTLISNLEIPNVDLDEDVGGYEHIKEILKKEVLELLERRDKLTEDLEIKRLEQLIPKGIIFFGPPGTGKTYLAKALATALQATIIIVNGPEIKSKWFGESEANLRRIFAQARKSAPSIIVFDELDSIASARGLYHSGSGVEHSMVNQLLTEMDGFRSEEMVLVIGTTNLLEAVDPALLRPGRFELQIHIPYPDEYSRREIINIYKKKFNLNLSDEVLEYLVEKTGGVVDNMTMTRFSGDHLYAISRTLKRKAIREGEYEITQAAIDKAISSRIQAKVILTDEEQRFISYHESGHALITHLIPSAEKTTKISIASSESSFLGFTMQELRKNRYLITKKELSNTICILFGGRIAEEMIFEDISSGAQNDLERASEIARMMVEEMGMSDNLGIISYSRRTLQGITSSSQRIISEHTRNMIDEEIKTLLNTQYERALKLLKENSQKLIKLAEALYKKGSLDHSDLEQLLGK